MPFNILKTHGLVLILLFKKAESSFEGTAKKSILGVISLIDIVVMDAIILPIFLSASKHSTSTARIKKKVIVLFQFI
ncbi:MAG: hypothetical protein ACI93L_001159 [Cyclobacteriaceae bacterium]|jgi:hypothetical protein